jgi:hypothetical protein
MASCWTNFRRNGIKPAKSLISTTADLASDWIFYLRIQQNGPEKYELYLFIFCCVASAMSAFLVISLILNARENSKKCRRLKSVKLDSFGSTVKSVLALEILLEDIPQFVLTTLVTIDIGRLTNYALFNITLSAMNFFLNLLDMIELNDENDDEGAGDVDGGGESEARVY